MFFIAQVLVQLRTQLKASISGIIQGTLVLFVLLFGVVACLVFAALAWVLVETGEISLYGPRVVTIEPAAGYAFRPTTPITLTFDQPMVPVATLEPASQSAAPAGRTAYSKTAEAAAGPGQQVAALDTPPDAPEVDLIADPADYEVGADGTIEIYFDDMKKPVMTASDKTFGAGRVGIGSFDDHGNWDDFKLHGVKAP